MTVSPEQVEAYAAQGYSLLDVARLIGVNPDDVRGDKIIDAFNEGARRWRDNGASPPRSVTNLIAEAVLAECSRRECTRGQMREALGFRYDDINLALDLMTGEGLIAMIEDPRGNAHFRHTGMPSAFGPAGATSVPISAVAVPPEVKSNGNEMAQPEAQPNGDGRAAGREERISARNTERRPPQSQPAPPPANAEPSTDITATSLGISIFREVRAYIDSLETGAEVSVSSCYDWLLEKHPAVATVTIKQGLKISLRLRMESSKALEVLNQGRGKGLKMFRKLDVPVTSPAPPPPAAAQTVHVENVIAVLGEPSAAERDEFCLANCDPTTVGHHRDCQEYKPLFNNLPVAAIRERVEQELADCFESRHLLEKRIEALQTTLEGLRQLAETELA